MKFLRILNTSAPKRKRLPGRFSRKPRVSELERGGYGTGSSSFPPQVDVTIEPGQTGQPGCSSLTGYCAVVKGRMPVDQPVGLEQALVRRLVELAELLLVQKLELMEIQQFHSQCFRNRWLHKLYRIQLHRSLNHSSQFRSIRQQLHIRMLAEPVWLRGEPIGRSLRVSMSEQKSRMGCSSIGYGEPGHRFRQQLRGEHVRLCRSDRKRMHS